MSEVKVNKLSPRSGTTVTLGDSGDTITIPSGVTLSNAGTFTNFQSTGIDDNATSTAITIDSSERVGIGTFSPSRNLHVKAQSGNAGINLETSTNSDDTIFANLLVSGAGTGNNYIYFGDGNDSNVGQIRYNHASDFMSINVNASEAMRIDSSGDVFISKTARDTTDGVELRNDGKTVIRVTGDTSLTLDRKTNEGTMISLRRADVETGKIATVDNGNIAIGAGTAGILFASAENHIRGFNTTAFSSSDNTIDIGRSSTRFKDLYLSGGAYLGGTGTANKLDDYEEGTWTPSFSDAGGGSYEYSNQLGNYTKIGNTVFISGYLITSGTFRTGGSGNVLLNGLPFSFVSGSTGGIESIHSYGSWGDTPLGAEIPNAGTSCNIIYRDTADGGRQRLQASDISISAYVLMAFSGFYKV